MKRGVGGNIVDFPTVLGTARPYVLKQERDSTSVPAAADRCSQDGKEAVGCVTAFWLCCSLVECVCQQKHQIRASFDHQITYFSLPPSFFISFRVGGK